MIASTKQAVSRVRKSRRPVKSPVSVPAQDGLEAVDIPRHTALSIVLPSTAPDVDELRTLEGMNASDALQAWSKLPEAVRLRIREAVADVSWDEHAGDRHADDSLPMIVCGVFAAGVQYAELMATRTSGDA